MIKLIRATCGQWLLYWTAQLGARWKHGHFGYHRDQRAPEAFVPQCLQCQALVKVRASGLGWLVPPQGFWQSSLI